MGHTASMSLTFRFSSLYFAWYLASSAPAAIPTGGCFCLSFSSAAADIVVENQNGYVADAGDIVGNSLFNSFDAVGMYGTVT